MVAPSVPEPLYDVTKALLLGRGWRYLRYLHMRAALLLADDVQSVLSISAGRGEAEVALAIEFPAIEFLVAAASRAGAPTRGQTLARCLGLKNVRFSDEDLTKAPRRLRSYDLVAVNDVLERAENPSAIAQQVLARSRRWAFALLPFAEADENSDPEKLARALERHGHRVVGFDAHMTLSLFPRPVALRGCFWSGAGAELRARLGRLEEEAVGQQLDDLRRLAETDLQPGWPARRKEAAGIWLLSDVGTNPPPTGTSKLRPCEPTCQPEPLSDRCWIEISGLFDNAFYAQRHPEVARREDDLLAHYLREGARLGWAPRADFCPNHYCRVAAIDPSEVNPLVHFLTVGRYRGLGAAPAPIDPAATRSRRVDDASPSDPVVRTVLATSGLIDAEYYLAHHGDVRHRGVDPLGHYLRHGAAEGRRPNRFFEPSYYCAAAGIDPKVVNPLYHYIVEGEARGLRPHPGFDPRAYRAAHPDAGRGSQTLLAHRIDSERCETAKRNRPIEIVANAESAVDLRRLHIVIIIPVYNGAKVLRPCLESLFAETHLTCARLLIVDDASTEPALAELLQVCATRTNVSVVRNGANHGFTRTVNRGIELAGDADVVLLNSDTVVSPGWLEQLAVAAHAQPDIASATALSDNAGAFSTPASGANATHERIDINAAARMSRRAASSRIMLAPTGNGFCMYVRRTALDAVGMLDATSFPRGYGEENDWCMRAAERGFRHVIALGAYVAHVNAATFGEEKAQRVAEARRVLDAIHPDYGLRVRAAFGEGSPLQTQRAALRAALADPKRPSVRPRVLYVTSTSTGGVPQTNQDLMSGVRHVYSPMLLTCNSRRMVLLDADSQPPKEVERYDLTEPVRLLDHRSVEYDRVVREWIRGYAIELIHIRHIGWHSLGLPRVAQEIGVPVVFSFHDFYTVCPSVNLVAGHQPWQRHGVTGPRIVAPLWRTADPESLQAISRFEPRAFLAAWQRKMSAMLEDCDALVTTAASAREIVRDNLPAARRSAHFFVIPHGREFSEFLPPPPGPAPDERLRLLAAGNINEAKGLVTFLRLLELDQQSLLELHVIGNAPEQLGHARGAVLHGPYVREEFPRLVREIRPHLSMVLSICPETFCHTLTESWAAGVPVVGSNIGAVGERLHASGAGWAVDPMDAEGLFQLLGTIARGEADFAQKAAAVVHWQSAVGAVRTVPAMASDYLDVYRGVFRRRRAFGAVRNSRPRPRVALVAQGTFPTSPPTVHVRLATPTRAASGAVDYDWCPAEELIRSRCEDFDGVLVCRNAAGSRILQELARVCGVEGVPLVLDLDDDLLRVPEDQDPTQTYAADATGMTALLEYASVTTVSTPTLLESYRNLARDVQLLENRLDPHLWRTPVEASSKPPPGWNPDARLRVLYCGGYTHASDLSLVLSVFEQLAPSGVALHVVGVEHDNRPGYARIPVPNSRYDRFVPWFRSIARHFDVAIAPLEDTPFNRCKSPLKFMEFAACGLPTIASNCGPYARTIRHEEDGLLAVGTSEWLTALRRLLNDAVFRRELAQRAWRRAQEEFFCTDCAFDAMPWRRRLGAQDLGRRASVASQGLSGAASETGG